MLYIQQLGAATISFTLTACQIQTYSLLARCLLSYVRSITLVSLGLGAYQPGMFKRNEEMEQARAIQPSKSKAGWILLFIGWAFFVIPIVGTFIGAILIAISMFIAAMQMSRKEGGLGLLLTAIFVSPIMWIVIFFVVLVNIGGN